MNLIDILLKSEVNRVMGDIFDTFARETPVTFYKTPSQEVIVYDANFHGGFQDTFDLSTVTSTVTSQSFTCRIIYLDRQDYSSFIEGGEDLGVNGKFIYNRIRLQCKSDGFEYLKDTERFVFGDEKYTIEESWQKLGVLDTFNIYEVMLRRVV